MTAREGAGERRTAAARDAAVRAAAKTDAVAPLTAALKAVPSTSDREPPTDGATPMGATRTRSIWWHQLVLGASVVVTLVVALIVDPDRLSVTAFMVGAAGILIATMATLAVPWHRVRRRVVLVVPFFDIACVAAMAESTDLGVALLWTFPVVWIGSHATLRTLTVALLVIGAALGVFAVYHATPEALVQLAVALVTLTVIGLTSHASAVRNRAFRRLLRRQAARHERNSRRVAEDERHLVELTDAVDDGIARIGTDGTLLFVNEAYARIYGMERSDLAQPPRSVEYEDSGAAPVALDDRPLVVAGRGREFRDRQVWVYDPRGEWRALSITAKRLEGNGTDPSMLVIARDITDVISAQREREKLVAMATHEMRHPLTAIVGNAELALDFDELTATTRERLEVIHDSSERLSELVGDFLHRTENPGPDTDHGAAFDLRTVVIASMQSFEAAAAAGEVVVQVDLVDRLPVVADAFRLRQVIDNLISNAVKYTGRGGSIIIAGHHRDGRVVVTVSDTGIGMSPADVAQIFDPYFRAETAVDFAPGTGLGMGIARDLLVLQGGTLTVDSRLRAGTTVTVDLPATTSRRGERGSSRSGGVSESHA